MHYINAFSTVTVPEETEEQLTTIVNEGWYTIYPEVNKVLVLNQDALNEVRLGTQMKNCTLPPVPYSFLGSNLNYVPIRKLARLIAGSGRQLEHQKKYSEALNYYLEGLLFGKDIAQKDQFLVTHMIGLAIINVQITPLLELIKSDKLTEKDLRQIINDCSDIDKQLPNISNAVEMEYRLMYNLLSDKQERNNAIKYSLKRSNGLLNSFILSFYFNTGHISRDFIDYYHGISNAISHESYQKFMQTDWVSKIPKDKVNQCLTIPWPNPYTQHMRVRCLIRLAQIDAAIQLYHLEKKQWPKSLNDLKPEYLPKVPLDPFINKPFRLTQNESGMYAYSVGPDFKDDRAKIIYDPTNGTARLGDIVQ